MMEGGTSYGDFSHEPYERVIERHFQALYRNCNNQRRIEMDAITEIRANHRKLFMETLIERIGPNWYQIFSNKQRAAVELIKTVIYRTILSTKLDLLYRTLKQIGIYRLPIKKDLMFCVYMASEDPKELFAKIFHFTYGHTFDVRVAGYDLNGKLLLTSMYHLGLADLISRLIERFRPDTVEPSPPPPKAKDKKRPLKPVSPYLERCIAPCWKKPERKPFVPEPLPNLDSLNDPFEPTPVPSSMEGKSERERPRRNFAECDRMLGFNSSQPAVPPVRQPKSKRRTVPIFSQYNKRKTTALPPRIYGCKRKLVTPHCDAAGNAQFQICGIFCVKGKYEYILGGLIQLPTQGDIIHGGLVCLSTGVLIKIFVGIRGLAPPQKSNVCVCEKKYEKIVFDYLKSSKCRCGHGYDFGHEDTFPKDQIPYFTKPTKELPMLFNYNVIYELDPKQLLIKQDFQNLWNKDSALNTAANRGPECDNRPPDEHTHKVEPTCLGEEPKDIDYLRCALGHMRRVNIAARLPDVHRAPELKEWMRNRIHGPLTPRQRARIADTSKVQSIFFHNLLTLQKWGHLHPDNNNRDFYELSSWEHLKRLKKDFVEYTENYRKKLYLRNAYITNLLWTVMYQGEMQSNRFRDIYFSYMVDGLGELLINRPYSTKEAMMRARFMDTNRMLCIPPEVQMFKEA